MTENAFPQSQAVPSQKISWKRVFWIALVAVVILAILIGLWWWFVLKTPTTPPALTTTPTKKQLIPNATPSAKKDETADWKTYTSTEFGFSVKYPQEWLIYDNKIPPCSGNIPEYLFVNSTKLTQCVFADVVPADLYVFVTPYSRPLPKSTEHDVYTDYEFAGEKGVINLKTEKSEGPRRMDAVILVNHGGKRYVISYPTLDFQGKHDPVYDQILSTFRFE